MTAFYQLICEKIAVIEIGSLLLKMPLSDFSHSGVKDYGTELRTFVNKVFVLFVVTSFVY